MNSSPVRSGGRTPSASVRITTLVVDDSPHFRSALIHFLRQTGLFEIVGWSANATEALRMARELKPDLVLIDVNLRGASGLEATHILKSDARPPKVIVLTLHDNQAYQGAALTVGADAFITKTDLGALLLPTIQRLYPSTAVYVS